MVVGLRIGDLYEAAVDDDAWAALPATAARAVGARSCVVHRIDADGAVESRWSYLPDGLMVDLARVHPDGRDVWVDAALRSGVVGWAIAVDDVLAEPDFLRSPLWNDVVRPHATTPAAAWASRTGSTAGCCC